MHTGLLVASKGRRGPGQAHTILGILMLQCLNSDPTVLNQLQACHPRPMQICKGNDAANIAVLTKTHLLLWLLLARGLCTTVQLSERPNARMQLHAQCCLIRAEGLTSWFLQGGLTTRDARIRVFGVDLCIQIRRSVRRRMYIRMSFALNHSFLRKIPYEIQRSIRSRIVAIYS